MGVLSLGSLLLPAAATLVWPPSKNFPGASLLPLAVLSFKPPPEVSHFRAAGESALQEVSHVEGLSCSSWGCSGVEERKWRLLTQHRPAGGGGVEELSEAGRK